MTEPRLCPECGSPLPADAPEGLCPQCLLRQGLAGSSSAGAGGEGPQTEAYREPSAPPQPVELAPHFPQLEILQLLGQGGMGAVYMARQVKLDRLVALKILPRGVGQDQAFAERFAREARALARLNHPNIVTIYDFGESGGLYYFLMEYVDGLNLRQVLHAGGLQALEALKLVPQLCEALQYAHDEGIVHRDIKPENILLDRRGRVKIADFGLAKLLGRGPAPALTGSRQVMGTPHYMAPEQLEKPLQVDHRADIYSLGVVFYEMLTGELPLGRFAPPSEKVQVDVRIDEVVLRTLEKEPGRRYQHASEVKTDVESIASHAASSPPAAAAPAPPAIAVVWREVRTPAVALLVLGILTVLIGSVFVLSGVIHYPSAGALIYAGILSMAVGALQVIGAMMMERLKVHGLAVTAGVLSVLPWYPLWPVGVFIGGWTVEVLHRSRVRKAFTDNPGEEALGPGLAEVALERGKELAGRLGTRLQAAASRSMELAGRVGTRVKATASRGRQFTHDAWAGARRSVQRLRDRLTRQAPPAGPVETSPANVNDGPAPDVQAVWRRVRAPAVGLLAAGVLTFVVCLVILLERHRNPQVEFAVPAALGLVAGGVLIAAALLMERLQAYWLALAGGVVALLPWSTVWPVSLIIGVWTLVVLTRPEVRAAFALPPSAKVLGPGLVETTFDRMRRLAHAQPHTPLVLLLLAALVTGYPTLTWLIVVAGQYPGQVLDGDYLVRYPELVYGGSVVLLGAYLAAMGWLRCGTPAAWAILFALLGVVSGLLPWVEGRSVGTGWFGRTAYDIWLGGLIMACFVVPLMALAVVSFFHRVPAWTAWLVTLAGTVAVGAVVFGLWPVLLGWWRGEAVDMTPPLIVASQRRSPVRLTAESWLGPGPYVAGVLGICLVLAGAIQLATRGRSGQPRPAEGGEHSEPPTP